MNIIIKNYDNLKCGVIALHVRWQELARWKKELR